MSEKLSGPTRIYLDYAAAYPLDPQVKATMEPFLGSDFGNPGAIHTEGRLAKQAVTAARQKVATVLGVKPAGVLFTGSGTESNNLAIIGHVDYLHQVEKQPYSGLEIITTAIEHPSITAVMDYLARLGVVIKIVPVDELGIIKVADLEKALTPKTIMVTFAYANSEVGVVQPVHRLVRRVRQYCKNNKTSVLVHLDAAQAPLWLPCHLAALGVDTIALDAGKCGGPKGVGILASRNLSLLRPIMFGGRQESGLRPGTENVAGVVGAAAALELAQTNHQENTQKVKAVRDAGIDILQKVVPEIVINGPLGQDRIANNLNFSLPSYDTEYAVVYLDQHGIASSTKSACAGAGGGQSQVVFEITKDTLRAKSTLRLSLGPTSTTAELETVAHILRKFIDTMCNVRIPTQHN